MAALRDPTVTTLNVSWANFGVEEAEKIAERHQHESCEVTNRVLDRNNIGAEGMEHLVRALQHENCRVTDLYLGGNNIDQSVLDRLQTFLDANIKRAAEKAAEILGIQKSLASLASQQEETKREEEQC